MELNGLNGLIDQDRRVLEAIRDMPLATAADIQWAVQEQTEGRIRESIARLHDAGIVMDSVALGFLGPCCDRFFLTGDAQSALGIQGATWHQPGCLMRLLERLPAVEWLYPAAAQITDLGPYRQFQWVDAVAFDAAVRYEHGWIALSWVGILRSEKAVADRLKGLGGDLLDLACTDLHPRPGRLVFVVPDLWEAELVLRVAGRLRMEDWVTIWCVKDESWHGARRSTISSGWVNQPAYRRTDSWEAWQNRVRRSWFSEEGNMEPRELLNRVKPALRTAMGNRHAADRWVERARRELRKLDQLRESEELEKLGKLDKLEELERLGKVNRVKDGISWLRSAQDALKQGQNLPEAAAIVGRVAGYLKDPDPPADTARLLLGVAEGPGMSTGITQPVLGEGRTGRRAQRALLRMHDWGLLRRWRDGKKIRYRISWAAFQVLALMDRTSPESVWDAIQMARWDAGGRFETHEYGVMDVAAEFLAAGCMVANGWRDNEPMGYSGGIVPDAMVWLKQTPFQPGWHYLEYERSARTRARVTAKLTGFDSPLRVNIWPVLVVAADDDAEEFFHVVGEGMGIVMLTTTIERVGKVGPVGNGECWRIPEYLIKAAFLSPGEPPTLG